MKKKAEWIDWVDRVGILLFLIIVPIYCFLQIRYLMSEPEVQYCMNDVYCCVQSNGKWIILPFAELLLLNGLKYEFRGGILVRMGDMGKIWLRICKKVFGMSALVALFVFATATVIGSTFCVYECNWTQKNSNVYYLLRRLTGVDVSVVVVMLLFLLSMFSMLAVMGMMIAMLWWRLGNPVYGYLAMLAMFITEAKYVDRSIFFQKISMSWLKFYYQGMDFYQEVIFPLLVLAGMLLAGFMLVRRKDMLRKEGDCY